MSIDAHPIAGGATYRMLRELGSRAQHSYAAVREPQELVVAQCFVRSRSGDAPSAETATPLDGESMALLLRDARCLARSWHPNIARVKHVDLAGPDRPELTIATELLDGATLADLLAAATPQSAQREQAEPLLPLPVLARILLDVLAGLHALHGLRDGMNAPLGAIHGELCPANVVVGRDGVARIVNVLRRRPVRIDERSEAVGYASPEALDVGGTEDPRTDVYAVGVMLWEGMAGTRLYDERVPARVLSRQREGEMTPPPIDPESPFARLADLAMRALAFDPAIRFKSAAEMAAELRKIAGARLASGSVVAMWVSDLAGERIRQRRASLDPSASGTRRRASERSIESAAKVADDQGSPAREKSSRVLKASPRSVAPTLDSEVPSTLLAASRPSLVDPLTSDASGGDDEDDDDLIGPRGSSPELDLEAAIALANADATPRVPPEPASDMELVAAVTPLAPNLDIPSNEEAMKQLISSALASPTSKMRAVALEQSASADLTSRSTPGDFVIPIDVTDTLNLLGAEKRGRRGLAFFACVGALALVAMGSFVARREGLGTRNAAGVGAASFAAPPPAAETPMPPASTKATTPPDTAPSAAPAGNAAIATTPSARPTASARPATSASATTEAARPEPARTEAARTESLRPAFRAPAVAASPAPPPAKPKKSIYDPDAL
jgi:serine/threonine-protein kinase